MTQIGITGHRTLDGIRRVTARVDEVLGIIMGKFEGPYSLFSSLAEGADRLVARRALELLNARLVVPLPLKREDFETDFSDSSRLEFSELLARADRVIELPSGLTRLEAYESAGRYILDHVDVLIAIWDGRPPRGPGGTGQMVAEARQRGLPLAWVRTDAEGRPPGRAVTLERFPK